jgi:type IV pilus assembly protein PilB
VLAAGVGADDHDQLDATQQSRSDRWGRSVKGFRRHGETGALRLGRADPDAPDGADEVAVERDDPSADVDPSDAATPVTDSVADTHIVDTPGVAMPPAGTEARGGRRGRRARGVKAAPEPERITVSSTAPTHSGPRLGDLLLEKQIIDADALAAALIRQEESGVRIGQALVEVGALDERALVLALAQQRGIDIVDLRREAPDPEALGALPESVARSLTALPLRRNDDGFDIVVADPNRPDLEGELARAVGAPVRLLLAPPSDVRRAIDRSYRALAGVDEQVRHFEMTAAAARPAEPTELEAAVEDRAPVVRVVDLILTQGVRDRASDIHIEPQADHVRVRMRIDGALHDVLELPAEMGPAIVSRVKIMADMNIVERRRSQDGNMEATIDGKSLDVRVASTPVIWGEKIVMRILDKSGAIFKLNDLGMPPSTHAIYSELVRSPFGMVICAGPTGSGKTTTLYATIGEIDTIARNVMTIEDPVEYVFPDVNQTQINEQSGVTFASGLKAILRQDPDVILIGEVRDVETARIAVQSALTGHFVLSSLHATDAASALQRFLDMGIEPYLIAPSVLAVVGQRLVRRICTECRVPFEPNQSEMELYAQLGGPPKQQFVQGEGCNFCSGSGYQDRIGVYEVLRNTDAMRHLIVEKAPHSEIRSLAISEGMKPLRDEAIRLVANDVTTISEILRSVYPL